MSDYSVLFGENELVAAWVAKQMADDVDLTGATAFGAMRGTFLVGGIAFTEHRGNDMRVTIAGYGPWLTRRLLRAGCTYAFVDLGCRRMTSIIKRTNKQSRSLCERIGFKHEGTHPLMYDDGGTALSYGMTRDRCKWLEIRRMGKPKAPKAPDPQATANAQMTANKAAVTESARVNAVDQYGPWGSTTYQRGADGVPTSQTISLGQQGQRVFDGQMNLAEQMGNRANQAIGQLPQGPLDTSNLPGRVNSIGGGPIVTGMNPQANELQRTVASRSGELTRSVDPGTSGMVMNVASRAGELQRDINARTGEVTNLGAQDFNASTKAAQDATFGKAQSLLQPGQQLDQQRLQQSLSDRGIPLDSAAGRAELDRMQRAQTEQMNRAAFDAVAAGSAENSRLFGLDATRTQINNAAAGQRFGQDLGAGQFRNQATNDAFGQDITSGRFANEAAGQAFQQNLASADFANRATGQAFGQDVGAGNFQNQATGQSFGQHLATNNFLNGAQNQGFNQNLQAGQFQNNARSSALQEQIALRNQGMNEAGFFMGGPQMPMPNFQQTPSYNMQAPDVAGMINSNYQTQSQQAQQSRNGMMSGLFGLGSAFLMSDRRLKTDVQRIGTGWRGLPLYLFRYVWGGPAHVGVMAQEVVKVAPEAVRRIGAFLAVDYDALRVA